MSRPKGCKDLKPRKRRSKVQFCPKGHDTFICGRYGTACKICSNETSSKRQKAKRALSESKPRKKKRFCPHGHDKDLLGRDKWGHCMECCRIRDRKRWKTEERKKFMAELQKKPRRKEYVKQYNKKYREAHLEQLKAYEREYRKTHAAEYKLYHARNKKNRKFRYVSFGQEGVLDFIRNKPINMVIDHYIPLQGDFISGLNVIWNLQYLTPKQNGSKWNRCDLLEVSIWYGKLLETAGLK